MSSKRDKFAQELVADLVARILHVVEYEHNRTVREQTCIMIASDAKLFETTVANFGTVERCNKDTAACNRIRALTFGL